MKLKLLALVGATLLISGCAFKDQKLAIEYTSDGVKSNKSGAICLNKFTDVRADKSRIGIVKNTLGMETANIITDQDITILVSQALKEELLNLGYKVDLVNVKYKDGQGFSNNCTFIDGKIQNFFVEPEFGLMAVDGKSVITVNMIIVNPSGKVYKKTYSSNGESRSYVGGFASLFKESMDDALTKIIKDMKSDLPSVIKQ
jgi:uncharacterized lipoprotein YajG